jgi:hypothetical protein
MKAPLDQLRDLVKAREAAHTEPAAVPNAGESRIERLRAAIDDLQTHATEIGNGWIGVPEIDWDRAMKSIRRIIDAGQ